VREGEEKPAPEPASLTLRAAAVTLPSVVPPSPAVAQAGRRRTSADGSGWAARPCAADNRISIPPDIRRTDTIAAPHRRSGNSTIKIRSGFVSLSRRSILPPPAMPCPPNRAIVANAPGHMSLIDSRVGVVDVADDLAGMRRLKRPDARSMPTANGGFRHYEGDDTETHTPEGEQVTTQVHRFPAPNREDLSLPGFRSSDHLPLYTLHSASADAADFRRFENAHPVAEFGADRSLFSFVELWPADRLSALVRVTCLTTLGTSLA
jgi:hypothetical protein